MLHAPALEAVPDEDGTRTGTFIVLHPSRTEVLIGGTFYAGEIKKSIFTVMNDRLPLEGVLPMHCSANVGDDERAAIFFGLSGTGKTTLSADPERALIGDDEHGWGSSGVFNFEGGCYAKVIRLSAEAEPEIYKTTHTFGTILENVAIDEHGNLDLDDASKTENTRAAYKLEQIANAHPDKRAGHPSAVVMLTADAFGILPPIARLSREQALYYFLSGFTAKLAGTEIGVTEPQPTFSTCFGAPFLPQRPSVYAQMLGEKLDEHRAVGLARQHRLDGRPVRRRRAHADRGDAGDAARRALRRARRRRVPHRRGLRLRGAGRDSGRRSLRSSIRARPGAIRRSTTRRRVSSPGCSGRTSSASTTRSSPRPGLAADATPSRLEVASDEVIGEHDVLVVGAGCAGMRAAIAAFDAGADVAMISKLHPTRSHSGAAEGGINAALGNAAEDSPEIHAYDTVKGSDYLGDQDAIEIFTAEAPDDIVQLENWGAFFSRQDDGRLAQRPFGAAGSPRTVYAADITGHVLIQVLYEQVCKRDIKVYEEYFAWQLVVNDDRAQGVICWDLLNGGLKTVGGKTVVIATGGAGRQYRATTNAYACTGDGTAMALHAGLPLKDMEFMQFHPTTLFPSGILLTEGCRGEGAFLLNKDGERFMAAVRAERARARVARRGLTLRADGDRRRTRHQRLGDARHAPPRSRSDHRAAPGLARALDDLRRRRPDLRAGARPARRPLPHGRHRDRQRRSRPSSPVSTPPASARACRCTARTVSAATR